MGVVAFLWLNHINPEFPINDDGIRDQLMARDCVELGRCFLIGPPTSVHGFHQGAVWLDLLIAIRLLGGNEATARTVVLVLLATGVGTLFLLVWQWLRPSLALPAALMLVGGLSFDDYPSQLINPSPSVFVDTLVTAGLLCYGLAGKTRYFMVSAFALGLAINVHIGSLSLVPSLLAIVVLGSLRPLRDLLFASGTLLATAFLTSRVAMMANVDGLAGNGHLLPILTGLLATLLASAVLGSWFRGLPQGTRAWLIGAILIVPFGAGTAWLLVSQRHGFGYTYLHPVLAPAAVLAAALVSMPFELRTLQRTPWRWLPTAAALAGLAWITKLAAFAAPATASGVWTLADATAIAHHATEMGWSYEHLVFRLQSNTCRDLLVGMSVAAPAPATGGPVKGRAQLQVLPLSRARLAALPEPPDVVPLKGGRVAILREVDSWLRPDALVACLVPSTSMPASCARAQAAKSESGGRFLFSMRSYPEIADVQATMPYVARYEIPLVPVAGETREVVLAADGDPQCGWKITRAEGVRVDGELPSRRIRLHSDTGDPGLLVFEKAFGSPACLADDLDRRYPPCILETQPGDPLRTFVVGS